MNLDFAEKIEQKNPKVLLEVVVKYFMLNLLCDIFIGL